MSKLLNQQQINTDPSLAIGLQLHKKHSKIGSRMKVTNGVYN